MNKSLFFILSFFLVCLQVMAQGKVGMLIGYNSIADIEDDDERAAAQWFHSTYTDGIIYTPSTISTLSTDDVSALWVATDRVGVSIGWQNMPEAFRSATTLSVLRQYLQQGGNLMLTNQATQLVVPLGRIAETYAPNIYGSGVGSDNPDNWGVNGWIGIDLSPSYDRRSHQVFAGLSVDVCNGHEFFPLIGSGWKEDHNCMWDFNGIGGLADVPSKLADFELKTHSLVLGTWQHVIDCACAGLIEFLPTTEFKGRIIANGIAAYEWSQNNKTNVFQDNVKRITLNTLEYLRTAPTGLGIALPMQQVVGLDMNIIKKRGNLYVRESISNTNHFLMQATDPANVLGAKGEALRFDGYSTFLRPEVDLSSKGIASYTFSVWAAPETYPAMNIDVDENKYTYIAGNLNETDKTGWAFELSNRGNYRFRCYTGGELIALNGNGVLPCYEWSHLVATVDAANCKVTFYRNGQVLGAAACTPTFDVGDKEFCIGRSKEVVQGYGYNLNEFNGLIDDVDIYEGVLPYAEIAETTQAVPDMNYPASHYANDIYRPAFHGMPTANWTNETHGAVYYNGKFHVFFQKCGNGNYLAHMHWGHIYSDNLYQWHEDRTAVAPLDWFDLKGCWSGGLFTNPDFNEGKPTIIYTGVDFSRAHICEASPLDGNLSNWMKHGPIIDRCPDGMSDDFRDPSFFSKDGKDYIIVGGAKNGVGVATLHRYDKDVKTWSNDGSLFFEGLNASISGSYWEMPNVTPLDDKWLFTTTPMNGYRGVRTVYWLGDIADDGHFVPTSSSLEEPQTIELSGMARDGYGLLSPTFFQYEGRTLMLGVVPDKGGIDNYAEGWAHTYSLPREVYLSADGKHIEQRPYSGLDKMRTTTKWAKARFELNGTESLSPVVGRKFEILGSFNIGKDDFGFKFFGNGDKAAKLYYSPADNCVTLDISGIERLVNDADNFNGVYYSILPDKLKEGDELTLHIYVDNSIADIFINDKWAFSVRIYASDKNADQIEAFANGTTTVNRLRAWVLDPNQDAPTHISDAITTDEYQQEAPLFNLSGQRVTKGYKGLTLQQGKKFIKQ